MIDTNLVIAASFCAISNLSHLPALHPQRFPNSPSEARTITVEPNSGIYSAFVWDTNGSRFWIRDGVVFQFASYASFYYRRGDKDLDRFRGEPTVGSDLVVNLASKTLTSLARDWNPTVGIVPDFGRQVGPEEEKMPFYWVSWPSTNKGRATPFSAFLEVDARNGWITYFSLSDNGFYDRQLMLDVSNRVYTPDPEPPPPPRPPGLRFPATNDILAGIPNWLRFCEALRISPGNQTNVSDVNWENSFVYTNVYISKTGAITVVSFRNSASFACVGETVFSAAASDACFLGNWQQKPRSHFDRHRGVVRKQWKQLAKELEHTLIERVGVPKELFNDYEPLGAREPPEVGADTLLRLVVDWRSWPKRSGTIPFSESLLGLSAEFDLGTGEVKMITFGSEEPQFIEALRLRATRGEAASKQEL